MNKMIKNIKWTQLLALILAFFFIACGGDDDEVVVEVNASFSADVTDSSGLVPFLNLSSNADTYIWDFGDGSASTVVNPVHMYSEEGTYTVVLVATSESGATDSFEDDIVIKIGGGNTGGTAPEVAAPDPTRDAANVISLFSDVYEDVPVDTLRTILQC